MTKNYQHKNSGFTIIEVMIVLAIAGLIMLIVFLAVPALQRSSRNTQRKNDAAAVASAIANYIDNNGGSLPTKVGGGTAAGDLIICGTTANTETAKLGYFTVTPGSACGASSGNVSIANASTLTTPALSDSNTVKIETGENCDSTGTQAGALSSRSVAVFYGLESDANGGVTVQCLEQ